MLTFECQNNRVNLGIPPPHGHGLCSERLSVHPVIYVAEQEGQRSTPPQGCWWSWSNARTFQRETKNTPRITRARNDDDDDDDWRRSTVSYRRWRMVAAMLPKSSVAGGEQDTGGLTMC
jgi:hypothetical protein